ncbi:MAG: hypothetical protein Q3M24_01585 [Candidatus Electrothrix aestuarii]|uniref:Uncharacterized protein n=1 Tax=Candidatus Electrothrix aestuarii TaxID=3062594 RepID=A0AAU8LXA0_9BACT|nr:hypothetical protein [Candidatus Electrothrix aestuarii]
MAQISLQCNLELLLNRKSPVWQDISNIDLFIDELASFFIKNFSSEGSSSRNKFEELITLRKVTWLLDRLVPENQPDFFNSLLKETEDPNRYARLIYAWARRIEKKKREDIFQLPGVDINKSYQALTTAWCDLCTESSPETLIDWWNLSKKYCEISIPNIWQYSPLIIKEYAARITGTEKYREALLQLLQNRLPHYSTFKTARRLITEEIVHHFPAPQEELPKETRAKLDWFYQCLLDKGFDDVVEIFKSDKERQPDLYSLPVFFWARRHLSMPWEQLRERVDRIDRDLPYEGIFLAEQKIPKDQISEWWIYLNPFRDMLQGSRGLFPIIAFCNWLENDYRDVLIPFFHHSDIDVAVCAYQAYLHKAPEAVTEYMVKNQLRIPSWQADILDRFMYAPKSIRPRRFLPDIQMVEYDMRLCDPLNHRAL